MKTNPLKERAREIATEVRTAATAWVKWTSEETDAESRRVARSDARAMRKVASLLSAGKITEAEDVASGLDTIVRETIPDSFWRFAGDYRRLLSGAK